MVGNSDLPVLLLVKGDRWIDSESINVEYTISISMHMINERIEYTPLIILQVDKSNSGRYDTSTTSLLCVKLRS